MTNKIYSTEIPIWATLYVTAPDEEAAAKIVESWIGRGIENVIFETDDTPFESIEKIIGYQALSPAMTVFNTEDLKVLGAPCFDVHEV